MNISNKRKAKEKARVKIIDLKDIPNGTNVDQWVHYYKKTGMLITNEGELTIREYEKKRKNNK